MSETMLGVLFLLLTALGSMFVLLYNTILKRMDEGNNRIAEVKDDADGEFEKVWQELRTLTRDRVKCQSHADSISELIRRMDEMERKVSKNNYTIAELDAIIKNKLK